MPDINRDELFQFASPDDSTGFLLWQVTNLWQRQVRAALAAIGLTHVQFVLLACLSWLEVGGEPVTQVMVAAQARTDVMMTSKVIRSLEDMALIARETHPVDPRAKSLNVTASGRELLYRALRIVDAVDAEYFASLGKGEGGFRNGLRTLRDGADQ